MRVESDRAEAYAFAAVRTFAWIPDSGEPPVGSTPVKDPELLDAIRVAVTERLTRAGHENVAAEHADVLLRTRAAVEEKVQLNDPYFSYYVAERYEEGTITLEVVDRVTGQVVWSGSSTMRLRDVARGVGLERLRYRETGEERDWDVEKKIRAMLDECPLLASAR